MGSSIVMRESHPTLGDHAGRRGLLLLTLLTLAAAPVRNYHSTTIADLISGRVVRTHVELSGFVTYQTMEDDGDRHIRICDSAAVKAMDRARCVVLECVPWRPCAAPKLGEKVMVRGIVRFDRENGHGWWELHPLEFWSWGKTA